jgi:hypothetical protein
MHFAPEIPFAVNVPVNQVAQCLVGPIPVEALLDQGFEYVPFDFIHAGRIAFALRQLCSPEDEPSKRNAGDVVAARSPEPSLLIPISLLALSLISQALSA